MSEGPDGGVRDATASRSALLWTNPDAVVLADADGIVLERNPATETVAKPFTPRDLGARVRHAVAARAAATG